jgi:hypothetical protein
MRKGKATQLRMRMYFSDFFGVRKSALNKYGAFDISLLADLPLFVDPFLLFNSKKPKYRALHDRMIEYLRFLKGKSAADQSLDSGLLTAWYMFPEVEQNWLGFSATAITDMAWVEPSPKRFTQIWGKSSVPSAKRT